MEKQERIRNVLHKEVNRENHLRKNYDAQALSFEQEEAMLLERMQGSGNLIFLKKFKLKLQNLIALNQKNKIIN